jgi:hypothetical protein
MKKMKKIKRLKFKKKKQKNSKKLKKREIFGILNCSAVVISRLIGIKLEIGKYYRAPEWEWM